jgi:hypothetical protein
VYPYKHTSIVFGFAHIDSNKEQVNLLNIRFTLLGGSSILCQSHGTLLPAVIARPLTSVKVLLATLLTVLMRVGLVGAILCQVLLLVVGRHNCDVLASDTIAYFRHHH